MAWGDPILPSRHLSAQREALLALTVWALGEVVLSTLAVPEGMGAIFAVVML